MRRNAKLKVRYETSAPPPQPASAVAPSKREKWVRELMPLVRYHANMIKMRVPSHIELADLISSGLVGLLGAMDRFDVSRGTKFGTFAEFRIRGAMLDYLREMDWFPRSARQRVASIKYQYAHLEELLGRPPSTEEVAEHMNVPVEEVEKDLVIVAGLTVFSLDADSDDEADAGIQSAMASAAIDESREEELLRELREVLGRAIDLLPQKEKQLIALYHLEELNMKEVGKLLSLSEARVCQLHTQAILRLRGKLHQQLQC